MRSIKVMHRILLLVCIPLIFTFAIMMFFVSNQLDKMGQAQIEEMRQSMMSQKRVALKNYIDITLSQIAPLIERTAIDDEAEKSLIKQLLSSIRFEESKDGYMFGYRYDGTVIIMDPKPQLLGKNLLDLKDPNGVQVIKSLIDQAKAGGGFVEYMWNKPSINGDAPKLSFATAIDKFGWMIGTGFYIDDIEAAVQKAEQDIASQQRQALIIILIIGLVLMGFALASASIMARKITQPLSHTAAALDDISQGEGDLTQRLDIISKDEIGQVGQAFNLFADKIHGSISQVSSGLVELNNSTQKMDSVVIETNGNVDQQKQETAMAATAVHQMAATAQEVANSASAAALAAQQADNEAVIGQKVVSETIDSIKVLSKDIEQTAGVISRLDTDTEQIGDILSVIKDITDQTNLLALNAAIEAARAGELGRGFSVVADEVRTLANRTQQSTEEIQQMIERLQAGAKQAVKVIDASKAQSNVTVDMALKADQSLQTITTAVSTITDMNTQIATAAEQQTATTEEISRNVQQVAELAENSTNHTQQLSHTSEELIKLENKLSEIVNDFKL